MTTTNETRREVMQTAWALFRADPARTFANALAGAWSWLRGRATRLAEAARFMARNAGRTVAFGSMLQSPIRRSLGGSAYAGANARSAGYVTSAMGL